jgi:hypothetical protein
MVLASPSLSLVLKASTLLVLPASLFLFNARISIGLTESASDVFKDTMLKMVSANELSALMARLLLVSVFSVLMFPFSALLSTL